MKADSKVRYGSVSRTLHWLMALLITWQVLKIFDRIEDGEHWVGQVLVPWHVSIGTLLLLLVVLRVIWATTQRNNRPEQDPATAGLVRLGHFVLYAAMALMPITGILTMIGNGYGWSAFGVELAAKGEEVGWMASLGSLHSPIAWLLLVMIIGHIGIALAHRFIKKDDVLGRML
ncbi:cytochrome b [Bordetella bronchiseptica]|uniref:cytochrome b n=1 Tax=Bordetella bronchiseptica TaxID=518 RepID=UPI000459D02C|nr:cytochrome b [Bordetella bronchiseptica]KAK51790.1 prokaryotic cytochrome b561 domain protein [Bordetella bronchiseptica OSU054]KDB74735.1 prokaryotic cytochrome b561 domain protein [Bordetella bronchiseptica CA90 BB1334]KDD46734.1 prokaryotic cytochrome b561 domain protein [Bordetella bronchiseptica OSU095]